MPQERREEGKATHHTAKALEDQRELIEGDASRHRRPAAVNCHQNRCCPLSIRGADRWMAGRELCVCLCVSVRAVLARGDMCMLARMMYVCIHVCVWDYHDCIISSFACGRFVVLHSLSDSLVRAPNSGAFRKLTHCSCPKSPDQRARIKENEDRELCRSAGGAPNAHAHAHLCGAPWSHAKYGSTTVGAGR